MPVYFANRSVNLNKTMTDSSARAAVLRSCGILFLFRALREAASGSGQAHIEAQILEVITDFTGAVGGAVVLGRSRAELRDMAAARTDARFDLQAIADRISEGEPWLDVEESAIACPIHGRDRVAGMIVAWFDFAAGPFTQEELEQRLDTLNGIATLASSAIDDASEIVEPTKSEAEFSRVEVAGVIAESAAMQRVLRMVRRVAIAETTVLIEGESGTGKEVIARALHDLSPRRSNPFQAINCAVLTENLLESELFGHERGAFTGAMTQKKGKVELAEGGTLFLDEIGELAPGLQAKLLRVLQQREFERVGGTRTIRLDVRVIAATNRNLLAEVRSGGFREDLYHRLNVISIASPALRERPDDIVPLALYFLERGRSKAARQIDGISAEARRCLLKYSWPGNVRELENVIERALVLGDSTLIEREDLPPSVLQTQEAQAEGADLEQSISSAKRESILRAWAESNGDYRQAAVLLGLHPNSLLRLVKKMNLRSDLRR
jgi:transcriptional regulator with GAF, ATPase, and Fis domain